MKQLNSPAMRLWLKKGIRKAKTMKRPSEGTFVNLFYKTLSNGWHYQVEYMYDLRRHDKPYVIVYAFAPPEDFSARSATHYLSSVEEE